MTRTLPPRLAPSCRPCRGRGWLLCQRSDGVVAVERCDECGRYPGDDEAALAAVRLLAAQPTGPVGFSPGRAWAALRAVWGRGWARGWTAWLVRHGHRRAGLLVALLHPAPSNRAHLLLDPLAEDGCEAWEDGTPSGTCTTDGHYLCSTCRRCDQKKQGRTP